MPRRARKKDPAAIYHIICRSNSELLLFRSKQDKEYYLKLLKRYLGKYKCKLYGYCLMDNHVHLHLDANGFDISKFMHSLNNAYVWYYNTKYTRHGHLFQDRFVSRILTTDVHNLVVSAYIHNNPHDIKGYYGKEEMYEYSSYGIYLGLKRDRYGIVDTSFIKGLFGLPDSTIFAERYHNFVKSRREIAEKGRIFDADETPYIFPVSTYTLSAEYEYIPGRTVMFRDKPATSVISFISDKLNMNQLTSLQTKCRHKLTNYRAFTAYALRVLCNLSYKEICRYLFNITVTSCSRLCKKGYDLIQNDSFHMQIFNELVSISA
ncbi:MAG TPA: transposase [Clostridiales bacterium]|nr:transposase [Clostridiales bacterium]HPV02065.1 transposase [Clostridiales bacterium]